MKEFVSTNARTHVDHNLFYKRQYFEDIEKWSSTGADAMAETIRREFEPVNVVDVGCGSGLLLQSLSRLGISVSGLDFADAAVDICRKRGLDVTKFDIESTATLDLKSGVVVSMEVAEHLPENCARRFVGLLTGIADRVVFTAAVPGQGGDDHVNEQPNAYWIHRFGERGFVHDAERSLRWREEWASKGVASWYRNNLMIFIKASWLTHDDE